MKNKLLLLLIFFGFCGVVRAAVVINEFVYDPSGTDTGLEWIELYNNGVVAVDLTGWKIETAGTSFSSNKTIPSGIIPTGGYFLIEELETATTVQADYISGTIAMQNGGSESDGVRLKNAAGVVQDTVLYDTPNTNNLPGDDATPGAQLCPDVASGRSLSRVNAGVDNNLAADFADLATPTPANSGIAQTPGGTGSITGKITEVAPNISGGDFIEIYVTAQSNVNGCKLYEGSTLIKTFPDLTVSKDSYIVLWASDNTGTDETSDANGNGYIDLYSDESSAGITGTDNNITLKNANDSFVDFFSFADNSISYTGDETAYNNAVTTSQWSPSASDETGYINGSFAWSYSTKNSISRKVGGDNNPSDTNTKDDWVEGTTSIGSGYGGVIRITEKVLEVFQSPFSPYNDGKYSYAVIAYNVPANSQITIRVFDIYGRNVKTIMEQVDGGGSSTTTRWDGRNDDGNFVPIGIYIVNIEAQNKTTGEVKKESKRVVVARKLN